MSKVKLIKYRRQKQSGYLHVDGAQAGADTMRAHLANVYAGSNLPLNRPPCPFAVNGRQVPYGVSSVGNESQVVHTLDTIHFASSVMTSPDSTIGGIRLASGEISTLNPNARSFVPSSTYLPYTDSDSSTRVISASVHNDAFDDIISIDNIIQKIKILPRRKAPGRDSW